MAPSTSGWAIASLICSLAGLFLLPVLGSVLGIIFGHLGLGEIKRSEGRVQGRAMAIAGLVIGYTAIGFIIILIALIAILGIAVSASQPS